MRTNLTITCAVLAAGCLLLTLPGCSKKSVQASSGSKSSESAKRGAGIGAGSYSDQSIGSGGFSDSSVGSGKTFEPDYNTNAPSLSLASGDMGGGSGGGLNGGGSGGGLSGLDTVRPGASPSEERLGGGTMLAKVQPGEIAARQTEELRQEQMSSASAGLRDVFFGYDSWQINEDGRRALASDADWIRGNPGTIVKVEGHCDERGTGAYNLVLGEKRAKAVRNYLVELGVPANQLAVVSYGKERPFCMEHAESCYQQNRRGHLVVRNK